jgi:hypothetical protein
LDGVFPSLNTFRHGSQQRLCLLDVLSHVLDPICDALAACRTVVHHLSPGENHPQVHDEQRPIGDAQLLFP